MDDLMPATVKYYNSSRGFGFVTLDDGREVFIHGSVLRRAGLPYDAGIETGRAIAGDLENAPDGRLRVRHAEL